MDSVGTIVKSWILYAKGSSFTKQLIEKRITVCMECPEHTEKLGFLQCKKCGCALSAKAANPELECPIKKWTKVIEESYF